MSEISTDAARLKTAQIWWVLWVLLWCMSACFIVFAFITPNFGAYWMWILAGFMVCLFTGSICKGFSDDALAGRFDTLFALGVIVFLNIKYIVAAIMGATIYFLEYGV